MLIKYLSAQSATSFIEAIVKKISEEHYNGNLVPYALRSAPSTKKGTAARFMLRCKSSYTIPARLSASGRRTNAASWEAHRLVMEEIFKQEPNCVIVAALATYNGKEDFDRNHNHTQFKNVGSMINPVSFGQL